jgi:hypothetical protein
MPKEAIFTMKLEPRLRAESGEGNPVRKRNRDGGNWRQDNLVRRPAWRKLLPPIAGAGVSLLYGICRLRISSTGS